MRTRSAFFLLSFSALVISHVSGQTLRLDAVYRLMLKVAAAPAYVAYSGTIRTVTVTAGKSHTVVVQLDHRTDGRDRVTIVRPKEDAGKVFTRDDDGRHRRPDGGPLSLGVVGEKNRVKSDLALLLSNYRLTAGDGKPVAGRTTYVIDIIPKYSGRKSKEIWVDRKSGIVLKSIVTRPVGKVVTTTEFTDIKLSPNSWSVPGSTNQKLILPKPEAQSVSTGAQWIGVRDNGELSKLAAIEKKGHFVLLSPHFLPEGFVMEEVREFPSPTDSHAQVVHILYSDGLSSISLFLQQEEPFWPDRVRSFFFGRRRGHHPEEHGVVVVEGTQNGTRYVLVSDVAAETLQQMADSLSPVKGIGTK